MTGPRPDYSDDPFSSQAPFVCFVGDSAVSGLSRAYGTMTRNFSRSTENVVGK
jgi:hypothetical protein